MLLLLLLSVLIRLSTQQCLTASDSIRVLSNDVHQSLVQSDMEFSLDLTRTITAQQPGKNIFFSPSGVFKAMLLAYFISANQTELNLKRTLRLDDNKDKLDFYGAYHFEKYYQKMRTAMQTSYQLNNVNGLFFAGDLKIEPCMRALFTDEIFPPEHRKAMTKKINKWVAWQTSGFIRDFLPEGSLPRDTRLVLVNAAYFKGVWKTQFSDKLTRQGKFYMADGTVVNTTMMTEESKFKMNIDKKLGLEVLELPYQGDEISMFLLLPSENNPTVIPSLVNQLDTHTLLNIINSTANVEPDLITVTIPKFTLEESLDLTPILSSMGAKDLFQQSADFSTLSKSAKGLKFSRAIHTAKIRVDEKGTEAAGVTAFIVTRMGIGGFIADKPFIYTLYNKKFNTLLFFGIFYSPPSN